MLSATPYWTDDISQQLPLASPDALARIIRDGMLRKVEVLVVEVQRNHSWRIPHEVRCDGLVEIKPRQ